MNKIVHVKFTYGDFSISNVPMSGIYYVYIPISEDITISDLDNYINLFRLFFRKLDISIIGDLNVNKAYIKAIMTFLKELKNYNVYVSDYLSKNPRRYTDEELNDVEDMTDFRFGESYLGRVT